MSHQSVKAPLVPLADEAIARAKEDLYSTGFAVFPEFVSPVMCIALRDEVRDLIASASEASNFRFTRDSNDAIINMNRIDVESDLIYDFARADDVLRISSALLEKSAMPVHVEYFAKPASDSTATPVHQDHVFYDAHFPDEVAISLWIPFSDVSEDAGALEYAQPPPAVGELLPHRVSDAVDFGAELDLDATWDWKVAPVPASGCVVHHSYCLHRTRPNSSGRLREAIVFNYRGSPYRDWLAQGGG